MLISVIINGEPSSISALPEAPVPWWSFTKTVLAATALTLVRDGLLGLDDPFEGKGYTLRQLLRHEAGLADYGELAEYHTAVANHEPAWPAQEMLCRLQADRLRYPPGEGWRYSNVGYMLVARLIERTADQSLAEAVRLRVLQPLGINGARFAADSTDLLHSGPSRYDPGWVYHGLLTGPSSHAALLLDRLLGTTLLPADLLLAMQETRTLGGPIPGRPWAAPGYALGLMRGPIVGGSILTGHTGCGPGSVIAVYRGCAGETSASCAVFAQGATEGDVEAKAVEQIGRQLQG
jgi:CubicO group peptidase (beta-lactamase class C family)